MAQKVELQKPLCMAAIAATLALAGGAQAFADGEDVAPFTAALSDTAAWEYPSTVATLTAANGDRLVLVSIEVACELEPLESFHATGVWTVHPTMSTGRCTAQREQETATPL